MNTQQRNHQRAQRPKRQRGFTLLEAVLVISLLAIILGIVLFSFSDPSDKARATAGASNLKLVSRAAQNMKGELGCYPLKESAFFETTVYVDSTGDGNSCGATSASQLLSEYNGPYTRNVVLHSDGLAVPSLAPEARGTIVTLSLTTPYGGAGTGIVYKISNIPPSLATAIFVSCIGSSAASVIGHGAMTPQQPCGVNASGTNREPGILVGAF